MIEKIKNISKNELFVGSFILLILMNLGNIINYIFHFLMARMLGPIDYGILAVLTNFIYIFSVPTVSVQTLVSRYTTKYNVDKEYGKIKSIFKSVLNQSIVVSLMLFIVFILLSIFLSEQLKISFWLLALTGLFIFIAFISPVATGILQGMKKFKAWGWNYTLGCTLKLIIAVILVFIGTRVYGAIIGFILGSLIAFFLALPFIKEILSSNEIKEKVNMLSKKNLSIFTAIFIVVLMYSLDIILVKKFFEPEIAGKYAIASLLGKIILFGTSAIGNVMFPISSEKFESGDKSRKIIKKTFLAIGLICGICLLLFLIFPEIIIQILGGSQYTSISNILIYVGIAFTFISLLNVTVLYKISRDRLKIIHTSFLVLALLVQILLLSLMHKTILEFSLVFMFSTIAIFIASLIIMGATKNEKHYNNASIQ